MRIQALLAVIVLSIVLQGINLLATGHNQDESGESSMMAARAIPVTSSELVEATVLVGTAQAVSEEVSADTGGYPRRVFDVINYQILRGEASSFGDTIRFIGRSATFEDARTYTPESSILDLSGQHFFDVALPTETPQVLLIIGGTEHTSQMGVVTNNATIQGGSHDGEPVRAFLLDGVNANLDEAVLAFTGWQDERSLETAQAALNAEHPLVAVDAMRIAVQERAFDQIEYLADELLTPARPTGVKINAIELLRFGINAAPTETAARLLDIAMEGWENEQAAQLLTSYLNTFRSTTGKTNEVGLAPQMRAVAGDFQLQQMLNISQEVLNNLDDE